MVTIYYCENITPIASELFERCLKKLPFKWREKIVRYRRWQDRQASLYGKLLLMEGLKSMDVDLHENMEFQFSENDRPSLPGMDIDFNISHTDGIVVCAINKCSKVGIDVEYIKDVGLEYYTETMTPRQWKEINKGSNRLQTFFKYWTMKESVLKVDGRGITLPLDVMEVQNNSILLDSGRWYINSIFIKKGYMACFATEKQNVPYEIVAIKSFESVLRISNSNNRLFINNLA